LILTSRFQVGAAGRSPAAGGSTTGGRRVTTKISRLNFRGKINV